MNKIFFLIFSLVIFSNNLSTDETTVMDWSFRNNDSFELDSIYTTYILRSKKDKISKKKVDFTITCKAKINEFSYSFSDAYYNTTEYIEKTLKKVDHKQSRNVYTFQVENDKATSYFYLAITLESPPEESTYVKISFEYPSSSDSDDSSSTSAKDIILIIVFVIIGICACGVCIIVSASKGLCEGCDACCQVCEECCHCVEECCKCLDACSK